MSDDKSKFYNLEDFLNKQIPEEIAEKLKVAGRIEQILKPTRTSAVSSSAQDDIPDADTATTEEEIDDMIDHVVEMEDLVEQLEDMIDNHLKDMSIPPATDRVRRAVNSLGSKDGNITKDVLDQADLIHDIAPILLTGQDPIVSALTGQGIIDPTSGTFMNCNELTKQLAKQLKFIKNPNLGNPEIPLDDMNQDIAEAHEKSLGRMILDIILKMFWNIIWAKFTVDHGIINPSRLIVAYPTDSLILFFQRKCGTGRFRRKSMDCIKKEGPINRILNKLRMVLICKLPPKFYKRYDPMVEDLQCPEQEDVCQEQQSGNEIKVKNNKSLEQMEQVMMELGLSDCVNSEMLRSKYTKLEDPNGPGLPPECYENEQIVHQAILDRSLNPPNNVKKDSVGGTSNSDVISGAAEII